MAVYTVHQPPLKKFEAAADPERFAFVRDGFSFWAFLFGGLLYYSSTLFELVPDAGWFAYTPLSGLNFSPDLAMDFW